MILKVAIAVTLITIIVLVACHTYYGRKKLMELRQEINTRRLTAQSRPNPDWEANDQYLSDTIMEDVEHWPVGSRREVLNVIKLVTDVSHDMRFFQDKSPDLFYGVIDEGELGIVVASWILFSDKGQDYIMVHNREILPYYSGICTYNLDHASFRRRITHHSPH